MSEEYERESAALLARLTPGRKVREYYGEGHGSNRTIHIRAVVDGDQIVCRCYSHRKGWIYFIESLYYFWLLQRNGHLKFL